MRLDLDTYFLLNCSRLKTNPIGQKTAEAYRLSAASALRPRATRPVRGVETGLGEMQTILIVEDDASMLRTLEKFFERRFRVVAAEDGRTGLAQALTERPHVIVLDISLPDVDGITVCKEIRRAGCSAPVLFLSAHDAEMTKLVGFDVGGDDYVTKPASLLELEARIDAILRRARPMEVEQGPLDEPSEPSSDLFSWGGVEMDFTNHRAKVDGKEVRLSVKETELLHVLVRSRDQVVSRRDLLAKVWNYADDVPSRTLDTHIRSLRRKLASRQSPGPFIETVHGVGYRFSG